MKRFLVIILGCLQVSFSHAQWFSGEYTTEVQWDLKKHTNWLNHLRLDLAIPLWEGKGTLEAATLHVARTREGIIDDWQGHSNIEEDNMLAALAVLGYMHEWKEAHLFVGVRNVNEDFFTSDVTSLFTNGSCGIFPTIAASYPIANFPLSGLTVYFDVGKDGWVLQRRGIQRLETPRQSLSPTPQDGWHLQHLPTGVHPSQGPLLCGRGHSHAPVCHRRGGRAGASRGGFHQDYLRLVGLWRTDTMDRWRASMVGNGTILGEHKPRQRLLPLRRDRKHL